MGFKLLLNRKKEGADQDGAVDRYTLPPPTTKRRTTANLKTKNNQNSQKIKLYGSTTTKELKKKHSFRLVGGVETGSQSREDAWQGGDWRTGQSHIHMQINQEEQLGSETENATQGSSMGRERLKTSGCTNLWVLQWQEKLPAPQHSLLERSKVS